MSNSAIISGLITRAAPKVAVVFMGREPRLIGTLDEIPDGASQVKDRVDTMLFSQSLSATFISIAVINGKKCIVVHG